MGSNGNPSVWCAITVDTLWDSTFTYAKIASVHITSNSLVTVNQSLDAVCWNSIDSVVSKVPGRI
jgi:hypothetical protein